MDLTDYCIAQGSSLWSLFLQKVIYEQFHGVGENCDDIASAVVFLHKFTAQPQDLTNTSRQLSENFIAGLRPIKQWEEVRWDGRTNT